MNYHILLKCKCQVYAGFSVFEYMFFYYSESPNWDMRKSSSEPSKLVVSFEHQSLDLSLKSQIMTVRNGCCIRICQDCTLAFWFKCLKLILCLARWSIEMNKTAIFATNTYLKSNAFTQIWNIQHSQRESSPMKNTNPPVLL